ncbi:AI-2E family transporter [Carnobacterium pleistocenium]|uniref:AI-2E family transporter n=1 Tax=Carnobacterium pleistocenium TaxID=181073 RepID=UPI00054E020E|nr:AI-2E family transporter [Carnobacterium pleistocenium]
MGEEKLKGKTRETVTWFWKWILNNKVVSILIISLLIFLNLFVFSKVAYLFSPIGDFLSVIGLPVILAGILYYLVNPLIDWMERKRVPRVLGIAWIFIVIGALIVWGITTVIPIIQEQTISIIENWPIYWENIVAQIDSLLRSDVLSQFQSQLSNFNDNLLSNVSEQANGVLDTTFASIGSVVGAVTNVVIAIITMPFILFYLLKDGKNLPYHVMKMVPSKMRKGTYQLLIEINTQISQYIRGQLLVAFFVGLMFWTGFAIIGLEYAVTLGVLAGVLNLVPYLGSFLATVPAVVIALVDSPSMLIKVLIVFAIEQTIEGRVIQPQILGNNLEVHPLTIIIVLLSAGKIFGVPGVILGIPGYAILKVIVVHFFRWYQAYTGLYASDENPAPTPVLVVNKKNKK